MAAGAVAEDPARLRTSGGRRGGAARAAGAAASQKGGRCAGVLARQRRWPTAAWQLRWPAAEPRCGGGPGRQLSAAAAPAATPTAGNGGGCECGSDAVAAVTRWRLRRRRGERRDGVVGPIGGATSTNFDDAM
ncbi:hypothetical protein Scep_023502 [Stephania cephalantha]|uniref:Uncharacterized protein n=1 Tax=Stephania cephalantha TaxID=152367 RepID=A0AAP0EXQ7_9MAGN